MTERGKKEEQWRRKVREGGGERREREREREREGYFENNFILSLISA